MSQQPPQPPPESQEPRDEQLSRTLLGGFQNVGGFLSTTFAFTGIVILVLGIILRIFLQELEIYSYVIMGLGGALLLLYLATSYPTVLRAAISRRGRYGTNTTIMVAAFIGLAALGNFLALEYTLRSDVTSTRQFSLAPRTEDLLKRLEDDIEVKAFFIPGINPQDIAFLQSLRDLTEDWLNEFSVRSGKFSYEFVDPIIEPEVAKGFNVSQYPTLVFQNEELKLRHQAYMLSPTFSFEQDFVTSLLIITGERQKKVYVIQGHGEADASDASDDSDGFGRATEGAIRENYRVQGLNLTLDARETLRKDRCEFDEDDPEADAPCEKQVNMLVIPGPEKDLLFGEADVLDDYLMKGGNILFLLDPDTPPTFREFLARWGVQIGDGHIVDPARAIGDRNEITYLTREQYLQSIPDPLGSLMPQIHPALRSLSLHSITTPLDNPTYYPGMTALAPVNDPRVLFFPLPVSNEEDIPLEELPTIFGTALAITSPASWMTQDPEGGLRPGDPLGPFYPAVAMKAFGPLDQETPPLTTASVPGSIVVFGDSDFATNPWFYTPDNSDMMLNSVNWLVGDTALISIRAKPFAPRVLELLPNEFDFMRYSSWFLLPAIMAVAGGYVWWRRR